MVLVPILQAQQLDGTDKKKLRYFNFSWNLSNGKFSSLSFT